jgi:cytochrome c biogenesis protein CcdA
MKYGTTLITLGIVNVLVIFSGLPTGWKKILIIIASALVIIIGLIFRTVAKKRKERAAQQAAVIEQEAREEINALANEIAADVNQHVHDEMDRI